MILKKRNERSERDSDSYVLTNLSDGGHLTHTHRAASRYSIFDISTGEKKLVKPQEGI